MDTRIVAANKGNGRENAPDAIKRDERQLRMRVTLYSPNGA